MLFPIVIWTAMLVILALAVREVLLYTRRRDGYLLRRLTLRLCMAVMLLYLLGSIYVGITFFGLADPVGVDRLWMAFWGCIGLLVGAVLCLVVADLRILREETHRAVKDIWHDMATIIAAHERAKRKDE